MNNGLFALSPDLLRGFATAKMADPRGYEEGEQYNTAVAPWGNVGVNIPLEPGHTHARIRFAVQWSTTSQDLALRFQGNPHQLGDGGSNYSSQRISLSGTTLTVAQTVAGTSGGALVRTPGTLGVVLQRAKGIIELPFYTEDTTRCWFFRGVFRPATGSGNTFYRSQAGIYLVKGPVVRANLITTNSGNVEAPTFSEVVYY